jgi:thioredoxin reductase
MDVDVAPYAPRSILETLPCGLPVSRFDVTSLDFDAIATPLVRSLQHIDLADLSDEPIWRDAFALTGTLRTFYSAHSIANAWSHTCASRQAGDFSLVLGSAKPTRLDKDIGWVNVSFKFRNGATPAATCSGFLSLVLDESGKWKIWMIRTTLEQLEGCDDVDKLMPIDKLSQTTLDGVDGSHTAFNGTNGINHLPSSRPIDCVVVGAGQAGLGTAGRLQALGISYVVLEKHAQIGDNWMTRYDSARLHTAREYNHLPFDRTFPLPYQEFLTKYDLAKGYNDWVHKFGIERNIWFTTVLHTGSWDESEKLWTLRINHTGSEETITCRHVIMAVGAGGQDPIMPTYPGRADFQGTVLHSADYQSADPWKGKAGIIIGTANTAHDVAEDMVEAGLSNVTMVQRTRTYVLPCEYFKAISDRSYNANVATVDADREGYSMPYAVTRLLSHKALHAMARNQPERFDALERAGFKCERYGDIMWHILEKLGGHYMDVGCSERIAKGLVSPSNNLEYTLSCSTAHIKRTSCFIPHADFNTTLRSR